MADKLRLVIGHFKDDVGLWLTKTGKAARTAAPGDFLISPDMSVAQVLLRGRTASLHGHLSIPFGSTWSQSPAVIVQASRFGETFLLIPNIRVGYTSEDLRYHTTNSSLEITPMAASVAAQFFVLSIPAI